MKQSLAPCCFICGAAPYTSVSTGQIVCWQCSRVWPYAGDAPTDGSDSGTAHEGGADALSPLAQAVRRYAALRAASP